MGIGSAVGRERDLLRRYYGRNRSSTRPSCREPCAALVFLGSKLLQFPSPRISIIEPQKSSVRGSRSAYCIASQDAVFRPNSSRRAFTWSPILVTADAFGCSVSSARGSAVNVAPHHAKPRQESLWRGFAFQYLGHPRDRKRGKGPYFEATSPRRASNGASLHFPIVIIGGAREHRSRSGIRSNGAHARAFEVAVDDPPPVRLVALSDDFF